jgi:xanthine dehydrogenase molybdopterin-binding subunit B
VGHLVCAVVADSEIQARRAADRVKIVYQDLKPLILTIEVMSLRRCPLTGRGIVVYQLKCFWYNRKI